MQMKERRGKKGERKEITDIREGKKDRHVE